MALNQAEALLFDWDGTVVDTFSSGFAAFEKVFSHFGLAFSHSDFLQHYSPNWYRFYERMDLPERHWEEADQLWRAAYDPTSPSLMPGAAPALRELTARGYLLAVVTSGHRTRVERELRHTGLADCFQTVVCGDQVEEMKPAPEALLKAAKLLSTPPSRCVYIGDAPEDVEMGRRAGALTVAVSSPYVRDFDSLAAAADYTIRNLNEILTLFPSNPITLQARDH
ncbi:MAG: HAD family hydrolase [Acidobacteria bacterium]|nr:HAD family hydrolase [Acidobacteriota bacterium]